MLWSVGFCLFWFGFLLSSPVSSLDRLGKHGAAMSLEAISTFSPRPVIKRRTIQFSVRAFRQYGPERSFSLFLSHWERERQIGTWERLERSYTKDGLMGGTNRWSGGGHGYPWNIIGHPHGHSRSHFVKQVQYDHNFLFYVHNILMEAWFRYLEKKLSHKVCHKNENICRNYDLLFHNNKIFPKIIDLISHYYGRCSG